MTDRLWCDRTSRHPSCSRRKRDSPANLAGGPRCSLEFRAQYGNHESNHQLVTLTDPERYSCLRCKCPRIRATDNTASASEALPGRRQSACKSCVVQRLGCRRSNIELYLDARTRLTRLDTTCMHFLVIERLQKMFAARESCGSK